MSLSRRHLMICQSPGCIQHTDQIQTPKKTQPSPTLGRFSCLLSHTSPGHVPGRRPCEHTISRTHSSSEQRKPGVEPAAQSTVSCASAVTTHLEIRAALVSVLSFVQAYMLLNKEATLSQGCFQTGSLTMSVRLTWQMSGSPVPADTGRVHADSSL